MSDQSTPPSVSEDRRKNAEGITAGGRRQSDKTAKAASKKWFIASMLLTAGIMAWTFTIPFRNRSQSPMVTWGSNDPTGTQGYSSKEVEAYVREIKAIEQDLQLSLRERREARYEGPSEREVKKKIKQYSQKMYDESQEILKTVEGKPEEGTVQWERLKELKEISEDFRTSEESE